jgi:hypothetical protein
VEVVETAAGQVLQNDLQAARGPWVGVSKRREAAPGAGSVPGDHGNGRGNFTGTREALVNAVVAQTGELVLGDTKPDGSRTIKGWFQDAYDAAFDAGALNSYTDDERVDPILPAHPLSRTRAWLATLGSTLTSAGGDAGQALVLEEQPAPARGPRRLLSAAVMRGLYAAINRIDLVEQSLREEIASYGDDPSVRLAGCLLQLASFSMSRSSLARPSLSWRARRGCSRR